MSKIGVENGQLTIETIDATVGNIESQLDLVSERDTIIKNGNNLQINESTNTNSVKITVDSSTTDYTLTLPLNDGDNNQYLKTDGNGALEWSFLGTMAPAGNPGEVQYHDTGGGVGATSNFFWDITNFRLGIRNNSPGVSLDIKSAAANDGIKLQSSAGNSRIELFTQTSSTGGGVLNLYNSSNNNTIIFDGENSKISIGSNSSGQIYDSSDNLYITNVTQDKDIYFQINDGGAIKDAIFINSDVATVTIPDGIKLALGSGYDGRIYSSSDDIYFDQATQDKDIIFRVNDGGVTTTVMTIDGSTSGIGIGTTNADSSLHIESGILNLTSYNSGMPESGSNYMWNGSGIFFDFAYNASMYGLFGIGTMGDYGGDISYNYFRNESDDRILASDLTGWAGIRFSSAGDIEFRSSYDAASSLHKVVGDPTTRMYIDSATGDIVINDSGAAKLCIGAGKDGQIYSSSDNLYIDNVTQDKDIIFRVNDGGITTEVMRLDGSESKIGILTSSPYGYLDISASADTMVLGADEAAFTRTNTTAKYARVGSYHYTNAEEPVCLLYSYSDGSNNIVNIGGGTSRFNAATQIRFLTAANDTTTTGTIRMTVQSDGVIKIPDGGSVVVGTGGDGQLYSSSDDLYITNVTQDKDTIFQINDGGVTKTALLLDGDLAFVRIPDGISLVFGDGLDGRITVSGDDFYIDQTTQDKDIIFRVNDGGVSTELLRLDGDVSQIIIPDSINLCLGTGKDGRLYSSSDDLYIDNITQDKDIIFRVNDGGVTTTVMTMDGSEGNVAIGDLTAEGQLDIQQNSPYDSNGFPTLLLGADISSYGTRTNSTSKTSLVASYHYTNSEEAVTVYNTLNSSSTNSIKIGGGTNFANTATIISFYTASDTTTTTGTNRMDIRSDGGIYFFNLLGDTGYSDVRYNTSTKELFYDTSSIKYKENIRDVTFDDVKFIYDFPVSKFDRKDGSKKDEIGAIAEEIEKINKKLVCYNEKGEVETYNKSDLVPYIIKIIQIQKQEIDELKEIINTYIKIK